MNTILKTLLTSVLLASSIFSFAQAGNHVFSGAEANNFGIVDLATPTGKTWSTFRGASPGYFSAMGTASYSNPDDANHIDGYVKHYATAADQAFNFPVGSGTDYRGIAISGTISATAQIATAWIVGNPTTTIDPTDGVSGEYHPTSSLGTGIVLVSNVGQWDWQDLSTNASGVTVTVSIPDMTAFSFAANLRLVGWDGTNWVNLSGSSGSSGVTENSTLSGTMISGISAIGIGSIKGWPDLTPTILLPDNTFTISQTKDFVVYLEEIEGYETSTGSVAFRIDAPSGFKFETYDAFLTTITPSGGTSIAVSNEDYFLFSSSNNQITLIAKAGVKIDAYGVLYLGFKITRITALSQSVSNMNIGIYPDINKLYDSNASNNSKSRLLIPQ